ncbi:putative glycosyltransferase [Actinoplanes missouriensis 431]|uniref:Putative glycosyltransferase n=1 Tax=Actinoplanes missouriensis (strain ATCC 14538 / DSM 43046 / CBS 188.64 / JCM 3121 / NBRC 102363 / NCIMB 12654 / NRRL B-3342 / UNCC 431) TaxID=512565 RepID=I0H4K2_ACTM4|nr:mycofactocin biosynthesis glycosyltransferase MftF [Actinoplanes missouriensis]BAL87939.1 putative glycosyltransferase [Actinoplanes missouriensis 431]
MSAPSSAALPPGFAVVLDRQTRRVDNGRALLGGAPTTHLLRLKPRARQMLRGCILRVHDAASAALAERLLDLALAHPLVADLSPPSDARCTYVIPVRDRPDQLNRLLGSIPAGSEVIVVDDASEDPASIEKVVAQHGARIVCLPRNVGPAGARNAGLRLVRTPFVAFVDSDIVLHEDTVPTLLRHFSDPRTAVAVPRITGLRTAQSQTWIGRFEQSRSSLDLGARPASVRPGSYVSWVSTACLVARVSAIGDGFDERMRVGEDVDFGWRAVARGWRVRFEPAVAAAHEHRSRFGDWLVRKAEYGTGAHPLAERHPQSVAPAILPPWSAALTVALLAQRRWSLPVAALIFTGTAVRISRKLDVENAAALGARLAGGGVVNALQQAGALITRHWWPVTVAGCLVSRRVRRAAAVAAVADVVLEYGTEYARGGIDLDPVRYGVARRLDDLAYGAGVWFSAARGRSVAALLPEIRRAGAPAHPVKPVVRGR